MFVHDESLQMNEGDQTSEATSQTIFSIRRDQIQDKNSFGEDVLDFLMER